MKVVLGLFDILILINGFDCLIQGTQVSQSNARFSASIRLRSSDDRSFGTGYLCAATIINNWSVLTTASCVARRNAVELAVAMGNPDLTWRNFVTNVQRISIHENFTQGDIFTNNIAVLRLSRNIRQTNRRRNNRNTNSHIQPIGLSDFSPPSAPTACPVFAWGTGNILLRAVLPIWNVETCGNSSTGVFCAGNLNNGPAVCNRNLGGPMICNDRMTGFVIDDSSCNLPGRGGFFQSISQHREWIRQVSDANLTRKLSPVLVIIALSVKFLN